jgi:hypothetical protein
MPIVKYIPEETTLPANVAREVSRYTRNRYVEVSEYEAYRNAAAKIDAKPIKYDAAVLYAFAEHLEDAAEDEDQYDEARNLKWAIGNTKVAYWRNKFEADRDRGGKNFNEEKWDAEHAKTDTNKFEASLFHWAKRDNHSEHPAVLLVTLLDKHGYGGKGAKNAR